MGVLPVAALIAGLLAFSCGEPPGLSQPCDDGSCAAGSTARKPAPWRGCASRTATQTRILRRSVRQPGGVPYRHDLRLHLQRKRRLSEWKHLFRELVRPPAHVVDVLRPAAVGSSWIEETHGKATWPGES